MGRYPIPNTQIARRLGWIFAVFGMPYSVFGLFKYFWIYKNPDYASISADRFVPITLRADTAYVSPLIANLDAIAPWFLAIAVISGFALYWHAKLQSKV